jgi:hypothetical protein
VQDRASQNVGSKRGELWTTLAALMAASFLVGFIPLASAMVQDSSPYVVGHWRLNDLKRY